MTIIRPDTELEEAAPESLVPSRMTPGDTFRAAGIGLRTRRLRSILSALGIMIGIASMVAVKPGSSPDRRAEANGYND